MPIEWVDRSAVGGNGEVVKVAIHHLLQVNQFLVPKPPVLAGGFLVSAASFPLAHINSLAIGVRSELI
jgi:hypothetical protein